MQHNLFRRFDSHVIFPLRIRFDREFREHWTGVAAMHRQFREAQQEQVRRWDKEFQGNHQKRQQELELFLEQQRSIIH